MKLNHVTVPSTNVAASVAFYKKLGFRRMTTAMAIFRDPAGAIARGVLSDG